MSWDKNVYYNPEQLGLEILGTLDEPNLSYEYNTFLVVRHPESGRVFWAQNSGCSCPTPFEDFYFRGPDNTDMDEATVLGFFRFEAEVMSFCNESYKEGRIPQHERVTLIDRVKRTLKQGVKPKSA